ncbi:TniQ family protein [Streptomyces botrytidirepellens]|uniref:TniQ family protein n=1 Tax=Streptomyces botrytidirepellens TaxID=2486417 RepID=UPI0016114271|nr:TniQ family protein [Streptomyces botrytidirepellens]
MTNSRNREQDRAVRAYKRAHPGITLDQARQAVAARSGQQPALPDRIPGAPLPRPAERLEGYVHRVAAAVGLQRHRAMELLGLQPGTSATERLDELANGLDDHAVRALTAATGMTAEQARALTAPRAVRPDVEAVRRLTEENFAAGHYRRGGEGKTSSAPGELAAVLAAHFGQRVHMFDLDTPGTRTGPAPR